MVRLENNIENGVYFNTTKNGKDQELFHRIKEEDTQKIQKLSKERPDFTIEIDKVKKFFFLMIPGENKLIEDKKHPHIEIKV